MKVIHLYVLKNFIASFTGACILIIGLYIIGQFMDQLNFLLSVSERTSLREYVFYFLWEIPYTLNFIYPLATTFAIIYTLGRMHAFNETISIYNFGKSILYICYPIIGFIFVLSTVLLIVEDPFLYKPHLKRLELEKKMRGNDLKKKNIVQTNLTLYGQNNKIYFIETYQEATSTMEKVSIVYLDETSHFKQIITADTIVYDSAAKSWKADNVYTRYLEGEQTRVIYRKTQTLNLEEMPYDFETEIYDPIDVSAKYAKRLAEKFRIIGGNYRLWEVEYHFKIATPYVPVVILLLGIPMAVFSRRATMVVSLLLMTFIAFIFIVFIYIGRSMGINEILPPLVAGWFGHIVFAIISYATFKALRL